MIHFETGSDLILYLMCPHNENRIVEMVAILCQICQRWGLFFVVVGEIGKKQRYGEGGGKCGKARG